MIDACLRNLKKILWTVHYSLTHWHPAPDDRTDDRALLGQASRLPYAHSSRGYDWTWKNLMQASRDELIQGELFFQQLLQRPGDGDLPGLRSAGQPGNLGIVRAPSVQGLITTPFSCSQATRGNMSAIERLAAHPQSHGSQGNDPAQGLGHGQRHDPHARRRSCPIDQGEAARIALISRRCQLHHYRDHAVTPP